jgi:cell fate regulator YaaT (PSP1 superfamily)
MTDAPVTIPSAILPAPPQQRVAGVRFTKVGKLYHFNYSDYPDLQVGDFVIVETLRGRQMGQVMGFTVSDGTRDHKPIMRPATPRDLLLKQEWAAREAEALVICREKAAHLGHYGDVKFVAAQYNYDGSNLTFLFTAEQKVNTNRLFNELRRVFSDSQIEMRQIGPRDVAKLLGGFGACGELRCCSTFLTDFSPISIKMAKVQGISLNPSEITGMCGRLRCCLVYEYEQYVEARKHLPKRNKRVGTPEGIGKVIDVHPLQDSVTVWVEGEPGGRFNFMREQLIPLEEYEALQKKASEPCTKHGEGEACDCGQKPGERNQDQVRRDAAPDSTGTTRAQGAERPPVRSSERPAQDGPRAERGPSRPGGAPRPGGERAGGDKPRRDRNRPDAGRSDAGRSDAGRPDRADRPAAPAQGGNATADRPENPKKRPDKRRRGKGKPRGEQGGGAGPQSPGSPSGDA